MCFDPLNTNMLESRKDYKKILNNYYSHVF